MKRKGGHVVEFHASGRGKAQCPPNPAYPEGMDVDASIAGRESCRVDLPYPAPECGTWTITCLHCPFRLIVTAAGRPDDPRTVTVPCATKAGMLN